MSKSFIYEPFWSRLDLGNRILLATAACLLGIGLLNQYFAVTRMAEEYRLDIASEMDSTLEALEQTLAEQVVVGDYAAIEQIMNRRVRRASIDEITWRDTRGGTLAAQHPTPSLRAPDWFRSLAHLAPGPQSRGIAVGGTPYGTLTVHFSAATWEDRLWDGFAQRSRMQVLELAVLFAILFLVLRGSLRQINSVAALTQRFLAGDYSVRASILPGTPPDIHALLTSLNRAAGSLEAMLLSLSEQRGATDNAAIVSETDREFNITYVNDKFCDVFGRNRAELLGQNHGVLNCGCYSAAFFRGVQQTIAEAQVWHGEICNHRKDGSLFWTDTTITPILDESGKPIKYVDIRFDITALKQAQEQIKHDFHVQKAVSSILQASLQTMSLEQELEHALDAIFSVPWLGKDSGGAIFLVDEHAPDGLLLMAQRQLPAARQCDPPHAADATAQDMLRIPIRSGDVDYGMIVLYPEHRRPLAENALEFLPTVADTLAVIIERKRADQLTQRLGRIIDGSLNEIYVFDADTLHFVQVNQGACRNVGYTQDELKSMTPLDLTPDIDREIFEALLKPVRSGELEQLVFETVHRRKDGSTYPVEVQLQFSDIAPAAVFFAFIQDITQRKQNELEIAQSREQLRELSSYLQTVREEEKAHIAREIHDELGGTLTALKMDAYWLAKKIPAELAGLHEKVEGMSQLVDTAVQATRRIVTELRPTVLDDLGLAAAMEWKVNDFQKRTGLSCHLSLPRAEIELDNERSVALFRILQESLTNVARHADAERVDVTLECCGDDLVMSVRDDGLGISQDRILNPTSHGVRGMFERARQSGGAVSMHGMPGVGTTVTVTIPFRTSAGLDHHD